MDTRLRHALEAAAVVIEPGREIFPIAALLWRPPDLREGDQAWEDLVEDA